MKRITTSDVSSTRTGAARREVPRIIFVLIVATSILVPSVAFSATTLTLADVRQRALEFNRTYLSAKQDVVKAQSQITSARSGALPDITVTGTYNRNLELPSFFVQPDSGQAVEFRTGFNNDFSATLSVEQSLWQGGKVFTALSIAKLYKKYSLAKESEVRATVILGAEQLFFSAILQQSNLAALQKAYEANSYNLDVVEKQYSQGVVSEFEVLRARVEKQNIMPRILKAESDVKLARKKLKSYIGIELNEDVQLIEELGDTSLANLPPLQQLIDTALAQRPEIEQLDYMTSITHKAVKVARGDYYPSLKAVSSYNWSAQSDRLTLSEHNTRSWQAGLNLTIPIFKGGATRGSVTNSLADYRQTMLSAKQARDNIKLEVEEAYDQILQAKKSLDIQGTTIAQAEEGLRIANVRYQSGVGTLLEVLSAQSALTEARNSLALATYSFQVAKAQLKKATTLEIN